MPDYSNPTEKAYAEFVKSLSPTPERQVTQEGDRLLDLLQYKDGWNKFLKTVAFKTFTSDFSSYHTDFWRWYWQITSKRVQRKTLASETLAYVAGWARGGGKSSNVEWACITEGAMGLDGYVLYVSLTQDTANKHVLDIRDRIEGEDIARTFPHLSEPKVGSHGNRYAWNQDFLVTQGGWSIRPVGLDVAIRGLRIGDIRPTMIILDDIDKYGASADTVQQSINTLARSILPAGTKDTIIMLAQNLIYEGSVVSQIINNKVDILNNRKVNVQPAFKSDTLVIDTEIDDKTGKTSHKIKEGTPTWESMDVSACQRFLDNSGLEAFYSEYQHDFTLDRQDRVIPEYQDFPTHVISWSQFEEMFGTRNTVPTHWQVGMGLDIGYSEGHLTAWTWIGVASADSPLPNARFRYRGKTFTGVSIVDQAEVILDLLTRDMPDEVITEISPLGVNRSINPASDTELDQIVLSKISHEKTGERMILNYDFGFNFTICNFKREDGIPQWRNALRVDKKQAHPFHEDERLEDGTYKIGRPNFFDVVDDDQISQPKDDRGLAIHRAQVLNWKRRKVKLVQTGLLNDIPMKVDDDANDATRMIFAEQSLDATPLSYEQRLDRALGERFSKKGISDAVGQDDFGEILVSREMALREAERKQEADLDQIVKVVQQVMSPRTSDDIRIRRSRWKK